MTPEQTRDQGPPFFAWLIVGSPSLWGCRLSRQQFLTRIRTHPLRSVEHHGEKQQQCPGISPSTQIFAWGVTVKAVQNKLQTNTPESSLAWPPVVGIRWNIFKKSTPRMMLWKIWKKCAPLKLKEVFFPDIHVGMLQNFGAFKLASQKLSDPKMIWRGLFWGWSSYFETWHTRTVPQDPLGDVDVHV